jgi:hypothetical protein
VADDNDNDIAVRFGTRGAMGESKLPWPLLTPADNVPVATAEGESALVMRGAIGDSEPSRCGGEQDKHDEDAAAGAVAEAARSGIGGLELEDVAAIVTGAPLALSRSGNPTKPTSQGGDDEGEAETDTDTEAEMDADFEEAAEDTCAEGGDARTKMSPPPPPPPPLLWSLATVTGGDTVLLLAVIVEATIFAPSNGEVGRLRLLLLLLG